MKVAAPPYSPPVEKPCTMRSRTSRTGAQSSIWSKVDRMPMANVATDINTMVAARIVFRPSRSPSGPQTSPPRGRTRKEIAKVASANRSAD